MNKYISLKKKVDVMKLLFVLFFFWGNLIVEYFLCNAKPLQYPCYLCKKIQE